MSSLSTTSSGLSRFVALLSSLPVELLGYVLEEGGLEIYRSALLRHVLVNQVIGVASVPSSQDESPRIATTGLEFLGTQYAVSEKCLGVAGDLGVDHLGIRRFHQGSPWYIQRKDALLRYEVRLFSREVSCSR
jgi:hypothetical protein